MHGSTHGRMCEYVWFDVWAYVRPWTVTLLCHVLYTSDIHESNLQMQLQTLGSAVHEKVVNTFDVSDYRKN